MYMARGGCDIVPVHEVEKALRYGAPGALSVLNMISRRLYGKRFAELLASMRIREAKAVIEKLYTSEASMKTAIHAFIVRPLISALGISASPEELTDAIMLNEWSRVRSLLEESLKKPKEPRREAMYAKPSTGLQLAGGVDREELRSMLACMYVTEKLAAKAYLLISNLLSDNPYYSSVAHYIALESAGHGEAVYGVAAALGLTPPRKLGEAINLCRDPSVSKLASYVASAEEQAKKPNTDRSQLAAEMLKAFIELEKMAGEEKYSQLLLPLLQAVLDGSDAILVKKVIDNIIGDEEFHEEAARLLAELAGRRG